jgi:large subunit ribosomal protein L20
MPRVKGGTVARKRRKKTLKLAKGYFGSKHLLFKTAKQAVMHSYEFAYRDRKKRKGDFRKLWISRINAAARQNGMSYSRLINGLKTAGVEINRKMLADIAVNDSEGFKGLCETAQEGLSGKAKPAAPKKEAKKDTASNSFTREALEEKTVDELKELCKEQDISGYSKLKKDEIIDELLKN